MLERRSSNMSLIKWKVCQNNTENYCFPLITKKFMKISNNNFKSKYEYWLVI